MGYSEKYLATNLIRCQETFFLCSLKNTTSADSNIAAPPAKVISCPINNPNGFTPQKPSVNLIASPIKVWYKLTFASFLYSLFLVIHMVILSYRATPAAPTITSPHHGSKTSIERKANSASLITHRTRHNIVLNKIIRLTDRANRLIAAPSPLGKGIANVYLKVIN